MGPFSTEARAAPLPQTVVTGALLCLRVIDVDVCWDGTNETNQFPT